MKKGISAIIILGLIASLMSGCASVQNIANAANAVSSVSDRTAPLDDNEIQWAYTREGEHPEKLLVNVINSAQSYLNISIYSLTLDEIVNAIIDAQKRGVKVRILTDEEQSGGKYQAEDLHKLLKAGIPIKVNYHTGLNHIKETEADGKVVTIGSYNYTKSASTVNDEVLAVITNEKMAKDFEKVFDDNWNDLKNFKDYK